MGLQVLMNRSRTFITDFLPYNVNAVFFYCYAIENAASLLPCQIFQGFQLAFRMEKYILLEKSCINIFFRYISFNYFWCSRYCNLH